MRNSTSHAARALAACLVVLAASAGQAETTSPSPSAVPPASPGPAFNHKLKAMDADNHNVVVNRSGVITLVLGTNEDSQDAARAAGRAVCPLQGRPDFQLIVVVDLRGSIATWVPSVVLGQMRSNLDQEAVELKPWYMKNGNKANPRYFSHVIPDFSGTICPRLGWPESSDDLRGILFGTDGREIKRWDKIAPDMVDMQNDVRTAIQTLIDEDKAKAALAAKGQGTKIFQPSTAHPPLLPAAPPQPTD